MEIQFTNIDGRYIRKFSDAYKYVLILFDHGQVTHQEEFIVIKDARLAKDIFRTRIVRDSNKGYDSNYYPLGYCLLRLCEPCCSSRAKFFDLYNWYPEKSELQFFVNDLPF